MDFWKNKSVFITGADGFVGGNLAKYLQKRGARVTGLIYRDRPRGFLQFEDLKSKILTVPGDLRDYELMRGIVAKERIEICFHLAAQVEVGVALRYPHLTFESNIRGTYTLLEALRESGAPLQAVIVASSDKAYGTYPPKRLPYKEDYPLKPIFPYDVSKACGDLIALSYASGPFQLPTVVTRFANLYGPGQLNFSALIPDVIRCALGHGQFIPRGSGTQLRDFVFIDDAVALCAVMAEALANQPSLRGEVFNVGTNQGHLAKEVVQLICEKMDQRAMGEAISKSWRPSTPEGEIDAQLMDYEKALRSVGWRPQTTLGHGLDKTIEWYRRYLGKTSFHDPFFQTSPEAIPERSVDEGQAAQSQQVGSGHDSSVPANS